MYDLFEFRRLLSLSTTNTNCEPAGRKIIKQENVGKFASQDSIELPRFEEDDDQRCARILSSPASIHSYAFTGPCRRPLLALSLTNANILFYALKSPSYELPAVRQLPWFAHQSKRISALCFDESGFWLLVTVRDATLFILPAAAFLSAPIPSDPRWPTADLTEIKLSGRRAIPTAIVWWKTSRSQHIAIVGNELGEISFVDLELRKEVGGTYVTVSITNLELITDEANTRVYLLITGSNDGQWQLILEQGNGSFVFPLDESNVEKFKSVSGSQSSNSFLSCLSNSDDRPSPSASKEHGSTGGGISSNLYPKRLSQFLGHTRLRWPERFRGRKYVSGYYTPTGVLTLHTADLNLVPSYVFKLPQNTRHVVLGEHLMFIASENDRTTDEVFGQTVRVVSVELATSSLEVQRGFDSKCELQSFRLTSCGEILGIVRCRLASPNGTSRFGCLLITERGLYCLRQKFSAEDIFLRLVLHEGCFTKADRLSKLFGMDTSMLYQKAAEAKLVDGHVGTAVRFYQMAKCPHIRSVANLAAHGHLSEVLRYVRVLFAKPTFDFSQTDMKHFSNVALYCYVQQCLVREDDAERHHFRLFLFENQHYDEVVALHLLASYGLYELLVEFAELRGLIPHAMNELVPHLDRDDSLFAEESNSAQVGLDLSSILRPAWVDSKTASCFSERGFQNLISLENDDRFVACLLRPSLTLFFGLNVEIAWRHLTLIKRLSDCWLGNVDRLKSLIAIYDPSHPAYAPFFRRSTHTQGGDASVSDDLFIGTGGDSLLSDQASVVGLSEEITNFFLKLLLHLNKKCADKSAGFNKDFVLPLVLPSEESLNNSQNEMEHRRSSSPLAAGFAHACYVVDGKLYTWGRSCNGCLGRGPARCYWLMAECVTSLRSPLVNVTSVACGAAHTLILTDCGVYAFGSNRYGQLGVDVDEYACDQTCHPLLLKTLCRDDIIIASITCGQYHSLALSTKGVVYSWGWGIHGQLGLGHPNNVRSPRVVDALHFESSPGIISVSAGYAHSVFLTEKGEVLVCGCGQFGQLGTGRTSKESLPIRLQLPEVVRLVAAGYVHNVAVTISGKIFTWGCNPQTLRLRAQAIRRSRAAVARSSADKSDSPRRLPPNASDVFDPESTPGIFTPVQLESCELASEAVLVSCGANHTALVTRDGEVYSWGRNLDGQLAHEGRKERSEPESIIKLNDRKALSAACGADFTLVLDDSGKVFGFGIDEFGQIGGAVAPSSCPQELSPSRSPSRVHTVRTSKRVVFLKSPTRCSVLAPVILDHLPSSATMGKFVVADEASSVLTVTSPCRDLLSSSSADFSDSLVHSALQKLHGFYNALVAEELCLDVENFQAAAKVELLNGDPSKSFHYNLRAITLHGAHLSTEEHCVSCLSLLDVYLDTAFTDDSDTLKLMLEAAIEFWTENSGSARQLEDYFVKRLTKLLFPISAIILRIPESTGNTNEKVNCFVNQLSSQFYLRVVSDILTIIKSGTIPSDVADLLSESVNKTLLEKLHLDQSNVSEFSRPGDAPSSSAVNLWDELIQNLWKDASGGVTSAIDLSSVQVSNFLRDVGSGSVEIVLFTCGHHYPKEEFTTTVLPHLEEALRESATAVLPRNSSTVAATYEAMGFQSTACPKCLLDGLEQEATG